MKKFDFNLISWYLRAGARLIKKEENRFHYFVLSRDRLKIDFTLILWYNIYIKENKDYYLGKGDS